MCFVSCLHQFPTARPLIGDGDRDACCTPVGVYLMQKTCIDLSIVAREFDQTTLE
jgi:hypothetical protein